MSDPLIENFEIGLYEQYLEDLEKKNIIWAGSLGALMKATLIIPKLKARWNKKQKKW